MKDKDRSENSRKRTKKKNLMNKVPSNKNKSFILKTDPYALVDQMIRTFCNFKSQKKINPTKYRIDLHLFYTQISS
jgi:hypothetical protein